MGARKRGDEKTPKKNEIDQINLVIPSFKRAGKVFGYEYFRTSRIVIPESQFDGYKQHYEAARLIPIPDDQDGNIARKRNWILRNIPRPLVMIDDDVEYLTTTEGVYNAAGEWTGQTVQKLKLSPEQAENVIMNGFNLAEQIGCKYWGLNVNTDGRNYYQYRPIALTQIVLGPFQGHLDHDLLFDERMGSKDDYDFSLQQLCRYNKVLRLNKYAYYCHHGDNAGGDCFAPDNGKRDLILSSD